MGKPTPPLRIAPCPPLSEAQLTSYLSCISSNKVDRLTFQRRVTENPLETLETLIQLQLWTIPYTSLASHYSTLPLVSLAIDRVHEKLVLRRLGGHCLEMNGLFAAALKALAYDLYLTGARINRAVDDGDPDAEGYEFWNHMVLIVTIDGVQYLTDASYNPMIKPIPLIHNTTIPSISPSTARLTYEPSPFLSSAQSVWHVSIQHSPDDPRRMPAYIFCSTNEWLPEDFSCINEWVCTGTDCWFSYRLVAVKLWLDGEGSVERLVSLVGEKVK